MHILALESEQKNEDTSVKPKKQQFKDSEVTDTLVKPKKQQFTYSEVTDITNNFANVIGEGGFGLVYSGTLDGKAVAVKMQKTSKQGIKEIQAEVNKIHRSYKPSSTVKICSDNSLFLIMN